jgi:beta-glucosidase
MQCGGWTIDWQGKTGEVTSGGTTILAAIKDALGGTGEVTYSADGSAAAGADATVVVVGEAPYAEGSGDDAELELATEDLATLRQANEAGAPVILVLLSGRPLILNEALPLADAVVAAWLPGTEGAGVADVLFGDHQPTGKLSFTWPKTVDQHPINVGDTDGKPAFAFGFGLAYGE